MCTMCQDFRSMLTDLLQAFSQRLPLLQDLAAHYGSSSASNINSGDMGSGGVTIAGEAFKEGMDAEERERTYGS
jgi:hypothetical protein